MHVLVNAAVSADGKLSSRRREQVHISGDEDFARVDRLRGEADAVLVGVGTVLADDPSLVRHDAVARERTHGPDAAPPACVVADSRGRTPTDAAVLAGDAETYLLVSEAAEPSRLRELEAAGATVVAAGEQRTDLAAALPELDARGVDRLLVEGGGEVVFSLFDAGLVDELSVFVGGTVIGGREAPTLADGEGFVEDFPALSLRDVERLDDGVVLRWDVVG